LLQQILDAETLSPQSRQKIYKNLCCVKAVMEERLFFVKNQEEGDTK